MADYHDETSKKVTFWISQAELAEWDNFTRSLDITRTQLIKDSVKEKISKPLEGINKRLEEISSNLSKFNYNLAKINRHLWNFDERLKKVEDANLNLMKKVPALNTDDMYVDMDVRAYVLTKLEEGPKRHDEFGDEHEPEYIYITLSRLSQAKLVELDKLGKWHLVD
ncbi:MAG: hypothetical protein ACFFCS_06420 [Candidatus Hodarchaeota archaeon]